MSKNDWGDQLVPNTTTQVDGEDQFVWAHGFVAGLGLSIVLHVGARILFG